MSLANVLLVDDEQPFVETMSKRLRKRDVDVSSAHSGHAALELLAADNRVEVVLTGHATVESAIDGMKLGAFDYLMKPCDMDHLLGKVTEAVALKRKQEEKIMEARIKEITARRA